MAVALVKAQQRRRMMLVFVVENTVGAQIQHLLKLPGANLESIRRCRKHMGISRLVLILSACVAV